ncbi:aliphatic sulfonate ABC transporter substrate-binding protein [Arthrobacter sp. zg-Y40]|uniref:aliphatic sulfonate ABC transporter substrate-binding protein n=1 Tax=Arthrobacter sp. zg-Y40 TaxID=2886939 RepID=UPI001D152776|nr:aliphatic sulfonate ABC transporter substrate-binding protein [Arthrobacter sp. zg-Y40]MCC3278874.1 aliphatic sulfonate ABC transporter substrate-binding protein [Arthrobacter sp. zg-Y40]
MFSRSSLPARFSLPSRTARTLGALAAVAALSLTGCVAGEDTTGASAVQDADGGTLTIDFATYNPLSLIIKDQGWLEDSLADEGVTVEWVQSAGSNKANENLRSGAIDIGSTAGSAALLHRANGSKIKAIDVFSQPEWSALVVGADSGITSVADLAGKSVAATKGTDPYFFLVQALDEAGLSLSDVTVEQLQHADGRAALDNGSVDAWAGLDPIMAGAEQNGARLVYRNLGFNTYGLLAANESFLEENPEQAQAVVNAYEKARAWAAEHPDETAEILADVAGLDPAVAKTVILERSNLDVDPAPGEDQRRVLAKIGPTLVETGDVASQEQVDEALAGLLEDTYVSKADPDAVAASR